MPVASFKPSDFPLQDHPLVAALKAAMSTHGALVDQQYKRPMAQAGLEKALAEPGKIKAEAGLFQQEGQYYPQKAQAEIAEKQAGARQHGAEAEKTQYLTSLLKQSGQNSEQIPQQSKYGIQTPTPTHEDVVNKIAYGIDTFGPKQQNAVEMQKHNQKAYQDDIENTNRSIESSSKFRSLIDQFKSTRAQTNQTGPILGHTYALENAKKLDTIIAQMASPAISDLRGVIGPGQFSDTDAKIALSPKPARDWNDQAVDFYDKWYDGVSKRLDQRAEFMRVASNPELQLSKQNADSLFAEFQRQNPISNAKGTAVNEYKGNEWQKYITPEAIEAIKTEGKYDPKDHEKKKAVAEAIRHEGQDPSKFGAKKPQSAYREKDEDETSPEPATEAASRQGYNVKMKTPDGKLKMVHFEDVAKAEKKRWSRV